MVTYNKIKTTLIVLCIQALIITTLTGKAVAAYSSCKKIGGTITTEISESVISIDHEFKGSKLTIFGTNNICNSSIIIILEGGGTNKTIIKKYKNNIGIWLAGSVTQLDNVPKFYYLISNKPIQEIITQEAARKFGIGIDNLEIGGYNKKEPDEVYDATMRLIYEYKIQKLFYEQNSSGILSQGTLFNANINIPSAIESGTYLVTTYLVANGKITTINIDPLIIEQTGISSKISLLAKNHWFLYYIICLDTAFIIGSGSFLLIQSKNKNRKKIVNDRKSTIESISNELGMKKHKAEIASYESGEDELIL